MFLSAVHVEQFVPDFSTILHRNIQNKDSNPHIANVSTDSRINWFHGSKIPILARKESSLSTTTSTAKPINSGGAKSHIYW